MATSLLVAGLECPRHPAVPMPARVLRWPEDAPAVVERQWPALRPVLAAITTATGVGRVSIDEAGALPQARVAALILELAAVTPPHPVAVIAEPGVLTDLVVQAASLGYAEDRLAGFPIDVLTRLHPGLRGLPAAVEVGAVLAAARAWSSALRNPDRWSAVTEPGRAGERAARVLSLAGVRIAGAEPPEGAVRPTDGGFELRIFVRGIVKEGLRLSRADDRLLVGIDGVSLPIELPAVLRRCQIVRATTEPDALVVTFVPDERRWPR
ncbi:hypothetical protein [Cumulibacter manganitolerans]|uniref:hypothetical protein n=1 Tax=Cumulibacter manganitolerans TaxID=1884992 RepID=UPI001295EEB9|nr:hypothetical protein [Cumulibacter manganitolerans]